MAGVNGSSPIWRCPFQAARTVLTLFVVVGPMLLGACGGEGTAAVQNATYVAALTGTREVPPVVTTATGKATFTLAGKSVAYTITAAGFSSTLTVGHVQIGDTGVVGVVIVPFTIIAQSGTVASGSIDLSAPLTFNNVTISGDSLRTLFETGQAYVNLHTAAFPGGEIRGQIVRQ